MSDNRIEGAGNKLAGSIKEGIGKLTGDHGLQAEGAAQKMGGSVQNTAGKVEDAVDNHRTEGKAFSDNRVEGAGNKLGGSIKEGVGKLTGDRGLQAEGAAQKTGGGIQNAAGKVEDAFKGR